MFRSVTVAFLFIILPVFLNAQGIFIVLEDVGCNISAGSVGSNISQIQPSRQVTFIVNHKDYYSELNAKVSIQQQLNISREINVLLNDSLELALKNKVKSKKDSWGWVYIKGPKDYHFISFLSELANNISELNNLRTYRFDEQKQYRSAAAQEAFASCPVCDFKLLDSTTLFFLSVYGAEISRFRADDTTGEDVDRFKLMKGEVANSLFEQLYRGGDTNGLSQYRKEMSFNIMIPISLKMYNGYEGEMGGLYYNIFRDSLNEIVTGPGGNGLVYFNLKSNKVKIFPAIGIDENFHIRSFNHVDLNDSEMVFLISRLDANSYSGEPIMAQYIQRRDTLFFKHFVEDYKLPDIGKQNLLRIPLFNNKYIIIPPTGELINVRNRTNKFTLDYKKVSSVIEAGTRIKFNKEKIDWINIEFISPQTAHLLFFYEDELISMYYRFSDSRVVLSQRFYCSEIKDKTSNGTLKDNKVYFVSKRGYINAIKISEY